MAAKHDQHQAKQSDTQHQMTMVWLAGSVAFDLNSLLEHRNFTWNFVLSVFLKRFDGTGVGTLGISREWIQMLRQEKWMILWYLQNFPEGVGIYVGVMSTLKISKISRKKLAGDLVQWQRGIKPRKMQLQRAQPIRDGQALQTMDKLRY